MSAFTEHEQLDDRIIFPEDRIPSAGVPTHASSIFDNPFRDHSEYYGNNTNNNNLLRESQAKEQGDPAIFAQGARLNGGGEKVAGKTTEAVQTKPVGKEKFILHVKRWWWLYTIAQICLVAAVLPIL